jgi:hypothetical protein
MTGRIEVSAAQSWSTAKVGLAFIMAMTAAIGMPWRESQAAAIAITSGDAMPAGAVTGVNAPSANCAGVQIGDFASGFWPAPGNGRTTGSGVVSCSDMSVFQGKPFAILSAKDTAKVGVSIVESFKAGYPGFTTLQAGEAFLYNRFVNGAGKVPAGRAIASATSPSGSVASASANQTLINGKFVGSAVARYPRVKGEDENGLAIGIVNDPFDLSPASPGMPGSVAVFLGDTTDPTDQLMLQASEPGDFATATYTLGIGSDTFLGLTIGITSDTDSVGNATFDVTDFDAASLGWADRTRFLSALTSDFTWDPSSHTLSETAPFLLNLNPLQITADDTILVYNYTGAAGSIVPEPSTLALLAAGFGSVLLWRRRSHASPADRCGAA